MNHKIFELKRLMEKARSDMKKAIRREEKAIENRRNSEPGRRS